MSLADVEADVYDQVVRYRRDNGIAASAEATNLVVVEAGLVDAIQTSHMLGQLVRTELARRALVTPAVLNIGTGTITFITEGAGSDPRPVRFFAVPHPHVHAIRTAAGSSIVLPGPADDLHVWLDPPTGTLRPEFRVVESVTCEAAAQVWRQTVRRSCLRAASEGPDELGS
ncbi:hypothetical protein GZH49_23990 [Nocardia terpenica]|uniref:hypothetical protein n=1 Tax=Nocardia terpenica TaxID=455432 RepID=UPI002FE3A629